jgi:putative ATP-dependent endonuclease of OLD family
MPNCAPAIIGILKEKDEWPNVSKRRWRARKDFADKSKLDSYRKEKESIASGQYVETFVSDEWTLEYDLAICPKDEKGEYAASLAEDVFVAACLAYEDDAINKKKKKKDDVEREAIDKYRDLREKTKPKEDCKKEEVIASEIYAKFSKDRVSKAVTAQYLAERLQNKYNKGELKPGELKKQLPKYLIDAIYYVTDSKNEQRLFNE